MLDRPPTGYWLIYLMALALPAQRLSAGESEPLNVLFIAVDARDLSWDVMVTQWFKHRTSIALLPTAHSSLMRTANKQSAIAIRTG